MRLKVLLHALQLKMCVLKSTKVYKHSFLKERKSAWIRNVSEHAKENSYLKIIMKNALDTFVSLSCFHVIPHFVM